MCVLPTADINLTEFSTHLVIVSIGKHCLVGVMIKKQQQQQLRQNSHGKAKSIMGTLLMLGSFVPSENIVL